MEMLVFLIVNVTGDRSLQMGLGTQTSHVTLTQQWQSISLFPPSVFYCSLVMCFFGRDVYSPHYGDI